VVAPDGRIEAQNERARELLGEDVQTMLDEHLDQLFRFGADPEPESRRSWSDVGSPRRAPDPSPLSIAGDGALPRGTGAAHGWRRQPCVATRVDSGYHRAGRSRAARGRAFRSARARPEARSRRTACHGGPSRCLAAAPELGDSRPGEE
jgi:hypothetical protein